MRIQELVEGTYGVHSVYSKDARGLPVMDKGGNNVWTAEWRQRKLDLDTRARAIFQRLLKVADPKIAQEFADIKVGSTASPFGPAFAYNKMIAVDVTAFWDAPDSALAFVIGHELGHVVKNHLHQKNRNVNKQQELEADRYGIELAKKLGYNRAEVFKFIYSKKDYDLNNTETPDSEHPTLNRRFQQARKLKFDLSRAGQKQLQDLQQALA